MLSNPSHEKLFEDVSLNAEGKARFQFLDWKPVRTVSVVKVLQDDALQVVFQDSSDIYFATTRLPYLDFLVDHMLTIEQSGSETRIRDSFGRECKTLEWYEIRDLTWKGQPLFNVVNPTSTAKQEHKPTRKHEDDYHKWIRPSTLQKMVKKFDGSGDPYDHVAACRQAVHAKQVKDTHLHIL